MDKNKLLKIMDDFGKKKIIVIGDFCLDEYIYTDMSMISAEAPVPRVIINSKKYIPGAAGNVACGAKALGANVYAVGIIGNDDNGKKLVDEFKKRGILIEGLKLFPNRTTVTYSRIVAGGGKVPKQHVLRFDAINKEKVNDEMTQDMLNFVKSHISEVDAIILADYDEAGGTGIVTDQLILGLSSLAKSHNKVLVGDSRVNFHKFVDFTIIKPNEVEASKASGINILSENDFLNAGNKLMKNLNVDSVFLTAGEKGIFVFDKNREVKNVPTCAKKIVDVCGAGDTVTCVSLLSKLCGATYEEAAQLASYAAAVTVSKEGTVSVTKEEIKEMMLNE